MLSTSVAVMLLDGGRIDAKSLSGGASPRSGRVWALGGFGPIALIDFFHVEMMPVKPCGSVAAFPVHGIGLFLV